MLLGGIVIVALVAACATHGSLPTHNQAGGGPAALLEGVLVQAGPCVYVSASEQRWLAIWPPGFDLSGAKVVDASGVAVATIGQPISVGGGEYTEGMYSFLRTLMPNDVTPACRGGLYWLVTDVHGPDGT